MLLDKARPAALILAGLTLSWVPLDYAIVPGLPFYGLFLGRLTAGFALLALHRLCVSRPIGGRSAVAALLLIPVLFFVGANSIFTMTGNPTAAAAGSDAYRSSAFMLAVGLSLFPLTMVEVAAAAAPILLLMLMQIACGPDAGNLGSEIALLWRLSVVIGIAGLSSVSQLRVLLDITQRATHDLLTGMLTRRAGEQHLSQAFSLAERSGMPLALLFVDLDRFKHVNDEYGHEAGDMVLRNAANALAATIRKQDSVIRWGGEEFLVLLPNTASGAAADAVERLGARGLGRKPDGQTQTSSIGMAERLADQTPDWESLVEAADARMYEAKRSGRNCWVGSDGTRHPFAPQRESAVAIG